MKRRRRGLPFRQKKRGHRNPELSCAPLLIAAVLSLAGQLPGPTWANPTGGEVVGGQASISQAPGLTTIDQQSDRAILNWQQFSIGRGEVTRFNQPGQDAIALNRVVGNDPSQLLGDLQANGHVWLVNQNGILVGPEARVDVHGFLATTADITDENFMAGRFDFSIPSSRVDADVINQGTISISELGLAGLVAPHVRNDGLIQARLGNVIIAGTPTFTLDFYGDGLIQFEATSEVRNPPNPDQALVANSGLISADGGTVLLSANAAAGVVEEAINMDGVVEAHSVAAQDGAIILDGGDSGGVRVAGTLDVSASEAGTDGGNVTISGERIVTSGAIIASAESAQGGKVSIKGNQGVSLGGPIDAGGATGGQITVEADRLSLAEPILATGSVGEGGTIRMTSDSSALESSTAVVDASGETDGGQITRLAGQQIMTSATYRADGHQGQGGQIDLTAKEMMLLSGQFNASGATGGGRIRLGGEFQGGKDLSADELPNAEVLTTTDATRLTADTLGPAGDGGEVIVWSDERSMFLGSVSALPGTESGDGGFIEVSSAGSLTFAGTATSGINDRTGTVLLDPKNITIAEAGGINQLEFILGYGYDPVAGWTNTGLDGGDEFGSAVSLDGNRLAVGAPGDNAANNAAPSTSAAYLFTFADAAFTGGTLEAIIGAGYTGGKNIDLASQLKAGDEFGDSLSLSGNRLVVGAPFDNGANYAARQTGAAYLFTFSDEARRQEYRPRLSVGLF